LQIRDGSAITPPSRRPAEQGLPWRRRSAQEHDPEKWIPVFGKDHAQEHDPEKWTPVFGKDHAQMKIKHEQPSAIAARSQPPVLLAAQIRRAKCPR
jgi:hypothetical protein